MSSRGDSDLFCRTKYSSLLTHHTSTFIVAAQSVGIQFNPDVNAHDQLGVSYSQLTIGTAHLSITPLDPLHIVSNHTIYICCPTLDNGRRCNTSFAFLKPEVRKRPNLTVLVGAHATRVLFDVDHTRAVGTMILILAPCPFAFAPFP